MDEEGDAADGDGTFGHLESKVGESVVSERSLSKYRT